MRKVIIVLLLLQITCAYALTPPATPGENVWDLAARAGQELDEQLEAGVSLLEVIESKVDDAKSDLEIFASCCENLQAVELPGIVSAAENLLSSVDATSSGVEVFAEDLVRIESKVDSLAGAIDQSLLDDFTGTWTLLEALGSHADVVESKVEVLDGDVQLIGSALNELQNSELPVVASKIDVVQQEIAQVASCCDEVVTVILPRLESKVEAIDSQVEAVTSALDQELLVTLPRIESKIDALDGEVSVVDQVYNVVESKTLAVMATVDAFGGSIGGSGPCDATPITQANFTGAPATYTITAPGHYCLAAEVVGNLVIGADDVTLDLNNHSITGTGSAIAVITINARQRVVVRNGRLQVGQIVISGAAGITRDIIFEDIQARNLGNKLFAFGSTGTVQGVTIQRCELSNATNIIDLDGTISGLYLLDLSLTNCNIGINSFSGAFDTILIKNCLISPGSLASGTACLSMARVDAIQATNMRITGSTFSTARLGISVININDLVIEDSVIENIGFSGIIAQARFSNTMKNIVIRNNIIRQYGVVFLGGVFGSGVHIEVPDNFSTIQNIYIGYNVITGNENLGGGVSYYGIFLNPLGIIANIDSGVIEYNTISRNWGAGIYLNNQPNGFESEVKNFTVQHNDLVNNGVVGSQPNLRFTLPGDAGGSPAAALTNTIVANKAYTTLATSANSNYSSQTTIPTLEWDRSAASLTVVSGGAAPTAWHNWSSIA